MSIFSLISLLPLQSATDFKMENTVNIPAVIIVVVVIVATIVILNFVKSGSSSGGKGKSQGRLFSGFAFRRLARNLGLNKDQYKMLDFVFKTDAVADPERSLNNTAMLDRHFRRAYRVIQQTSKNDEETQIRLFILFSTRNILENKADTSFISTKQLKDHMEAILVYGKEKYKVAVVSTKGDHLAIECPENALGTQIKIPRGTLLTAIVFPTSNKGFTFDTRVVGMSTVHGHPALLVVHAKMKHLSQRRFRRRQSTIDCNFNLVIIEGQGKKQRMVVDKKRFAGRIMDISIGGCSFKTASSLRGGDLLKIEFVQGDDHVAALGRILRTNRAGTTTIAHITFLKITQKSMNIINAYVYEYANEQ